METDATRMCALLLGLPDVNVLGVVEGSISVALAAILALTLVWGFQRDRRR